jgi:hypothetical protein
MKRAFVPLLLSLACVVSGAQAANEAWNAPFTVQVGAFRAAAETTVRLDPNDRFEGTTIHIESDLNVEDSKTLPDVQFLWRINDRHALEASWVSLKRSGVVRISGQIVFGDVTFNINERVDSTFDSDVARLSYRYSFINDRAGNELSALLGVHYTTLKASISALDRRLDEAESVEAPLPTIGMRGSWRVADNWRLSGFAQALKLKVRDIDGEILNATASIDWAFTRNAYASLAYNYYKFKIRSERERNPGQFDFRFDGPALYVGYAF